MKLSAQVFFVLALFAASIAAAWWIRGQQKDREFAASIAVSPHRTDTTITHDEIPQAPRDTSMTILSVITRTDREAIDSAFYAGYNHGVDSLHAAFLHAAAPIDTVVTFDSSGAVRMRFVPITRCLSVGLILPPLKTTTIAITDSVRIPMPDPDSFATRATIFASGAAAAVLILSLTR